MKNLLLFLVTLISLAVLNACKIEDAANSNQNTQPEWKGFEGQGAWAPPGYGNAACQLPNPAAPSCGDFKNLKDCLVRDCNLGCAGGCEVKYCDSNGDFTHSGDAMKESCTGCKGFFNVGVVYCADTYRDAHGGADPGSCRDLIGARGGRAARNAVSEAPSDTETADLCLNEEFLYDQH